MWCPTCRADVAAELSTDNRRMLCARCQSELGIASAGMPHAVKMPSFGETERDARELLAKWTSQNFIESPIPLPTSFKKLNEVSNLQETSRDFRVVHSAMTGKSLPVPYVEPAKEPSNTSTLISVKSQDDSVKNQEEPVLSTEEIASRHMSYPVPKAEPPVQPAARIAAPPQLHFTVESRSDVFQDPPVRHAIPQPPHRKTKVPALIGQICAYSGVGLLTCGSVLVMWSFFGGPASYMPTGWLTAAVGQMLLFLGVVTLISSGMDQTVEEVAWRIDHLAEEMHHMGLELDSLERELRQTRLEQSDSAAMSPQDDAARKAA